MAVYALIKAGKVDNAILADKAFIDANGAQLADRCVDITNLNPRPGPGWTYDGATFSRPAGA
jgi:hypothetical protein